MKIILSRIAFRCGRLPNIRVGLKTGGFKVEIWDTIIWVMPISIWGSIPRPSWFGIDLWS